ncbi:hypothetical protein GLYMA_U006002v4 [Glycine max]|nr:hypothetical protein GLYMA_U006002v4 [Glycine max]
MVEEESGLPIVNLHASHCAVIHPNRRQVKEMRKRKKMRILLKAIHLKRREV